MPRCFLVCGPTSSGNRLVTRLLVAAGCAGRGDHHQPWDVPGQWDQIALPPPKKKNVVVCRSLPHGVEGFWPDISRLLGAIGASGYEPFLVITVRDPDCSERSHRNNHACAGDYHRAYRTIFASVDDLPWTFAVYEALLLGGLNAVNALLNRCGIKSLADLPELLRNENIKHWRG